MEQLTQTTSGKQKLLEQELLEGASEIHLIEESNDSFYVFTEKIFSKSTEILKDRTWVGGPFIKNICDWLQSNPETCRISARDHFKSMSFYAHIMWKIWKLRFDPQMAREIQYFSYKRDMARYHLGKIKNAIECNPFFFGIIDHKKSAEGVISYSWDGKNKITVSPKGLLEFKRGVHSKDVYVDDPLQDPDNKMLLTRIYKINDIMKDQILDMYQNELHIAGTTQTPVDFYFDQGFIGELSFRRLPAIVNENTKEVLWKEWIDYPGLMRKKKRKGKRSFNQEYLCSPSHTEASYIEREDLLKVTNPELVNYNPLVFKKMAPDEWKEMEDGEFTGEMKYDIVAGYDLGKKQHPSHFVAYILTPKKRKQICSKWFDGVDYNEQLGWIEMAIEEMGITQVFYDKTRGEFEMKEELGELPAEMEGVHFTSKVKNKMATELDSLVTSQEIELINDQRQIDQILLVDGDLQAPVTPQGHGDSFWSNGLSVMDRETSEVDITIV